MESADAILKPWENFSVILGGAAAALTGLVFVVITIISGDNDRPRTKEGTAVFTTPTVVHFGTALLVAFVLSVPWNSIVYVALSFGLIGAFGIVYVVRTIVRMSRLSTYEPDAEDIVWHSCFPLVSYAAIGIGGCTLVHVPTPSMLAFACASTLLIFVGIHNAWDIVTFVAVPDDAGEADA